MKILYGVQGTGNGHMTRARVMAKALAEAGIATDYLVSGRPLDQLFDMQPFGDFFWRQGLTFAVSAGSINLWQTLKQASLRQLWRDIRSLDLSAYDLVITDFEPVTAWAAKLQGVPSLALSHQASFRYDVPKRGYNLAARILMSGFAPASEHIGLHWHHFDQTILPPIIDIEHRSLPALKNKVVVYLPFEALTKIETMLLSQPNTNFYCYHPAISSAKLQQHIQWLPLSKQSFANDLADAEGVICNSGFELPSEALFLGKKLLVKPLVGQFEQESNAATLAKLQLAQVMDTLSASSLNEFLATPAKMPLSYPCVAAALAGWLAQQRSEPLEKVAERLWAKVSI
ncbi:glycosyltransferase [Corallincola holothuriorum]|uniref:Glycosyltransferase n=1 Tax=Corallincola holothuriorum TaxID=2282215 RepID=A0A368N4M7_9GAMM|nr:MJ1255/VC2487 family glycosyltransferase [Corallincola holothuriorum]RCU45130.1 glycosyltransferase [Corallincola holothuriorum]